MSGLLAAAAGASTWTCRPPRSTPGGPAAVVDVSTMRSAPALGEATDAAIGSDGGAIVLVTEVPSAVCTISSRRQLASQPSSGSVL